MGKKTKFTDGLSQEKIHSYFAPANATPAKRKADLPYIPACPNSTARLPLMPHSPLLLPPALPPTESRSAEKKKAAAQRKRSKAIIIDSSSDEDATPAVVKEKKSSSPPILKKAAVPEKPVAVPTDPSSFFKKPVKRSDKLAAGSSSSAVARAIENDPTIGMSAEDLFEGMDTDDVIVLDADHDAAKAGDVVVSGDGKLEKTSTTTTPKKRSISGKEGVPSASKKAKIDPQAADLTSTPESVDLTSARDSVKLTSPPKDVNLTTVPKAVNLTTVPKAVNLTSAPEAVKKPKVAKTPVKKIDSSSVSEAQPATVKETVKKTPVKQPSSTERKKSVPAKAEASAEPPAADQKEAPKKSNYAAFLAKKAAKDSGPRQKRPLPEGEPDCLKGISFVFTGELPALDRDTAVDLVRRYGGDVKSSISKKTGYVVVGDEPGPSKMKKVESLGVKTLNEDQLVELIQKEHTKSGVPEKAGGKAKASKPSSKASTPAKATVSKSQSFAGTSSKASGSSGISKSTSMGSQLPVPPPKAQAGTSALLWTEKYKPKSYDELIGNNVHFEKIKKWLRSWQVNLKKGFSGKGDDSYRAVLLSGPPGIGLRACANVYGYVGKTTAAHLIAELEGWEALEFNASDHRSKKTVEAAVKDLVKNRNIQEFFKPTGQQRQQRKQLVIMDEVDGMDRGGSTALINIVKKSQVPIICICNDRQSDKVKSLANHCMDLKFRKLTVQQIEKRITKIARDEGLMLDSNVVQQLVQGTQADVRQILNLLSTWKLSNDRISYVDSKKMMSTAEKNPHRTVFDCIDQLLTVSSFRSKSFTDKMDLYFSDFSMMSLMVAENYLKNDPVTARDITNATVRNGRGPQGYSAKDTHALEVLQCLSNAADSISDGDLTDSLLRESNNWSLLPVHGAISTVRPCFFMHGTPLENKGWGAYSFPSWLGQNSKAGKHTRAVRELSTKMRVKVSADATQVRQTYIPTLCMLLSRPLVTAGKEGIQPVIDLMDGYFLNRDDWDAIMDVTIGSMARDKICEGMESKVKSAFTSTYNKGSHPVPFVSIKSFKAVKSSAPKADFEDAFEADEDESPDSGPEDVDDIAVDKMIKQKSKGKGKAAAGKPAKGKGKARAK